MMRCPRCGSTQVRPSIFTLPVAALREFGCLQCGLIEDRRTDAADFAEWLARWIPDKPAPPSATPAKD